jgi:hypothetical protein
MAMESYTPSMTAMTQYAYQLVWNKTIPCQRGYKIYLKICLRNPTHATEDTECISTFVDQIHPMPEITLNVTHHVLTNPLPREQGLKLYHLLVLTKLLPYQRGHKMQLILC